MRPLRRRAGGWFRLDTCGHNLTVPTGGPPHASLTFRIAAELRAAGDHTRGFEGMGLELLGLRQRWNEVAPGETLKPLLTTGG